MISTRGRKYDFLKKRENSKIHFGTTPTRHCQIHLFRRQSNNMNFMEISKLPNKGNGIGRISNKMSIITSFDHKHLKN